jgi:hypothetical protein
VSRYSAPRNQTEKTVRQHDFGGVTDKRGRAIGAQVTTGEVDYVALPDTMEDGSPRLGGYTMVPGHYYTFRPHATRNGQEYGPTQREQHFSNESERQLAIDQYLLSARRRAGAPRSRFGSR